MILKESKLEDINKYSNKVKNPNENPEYQYCLKAYALRISQNYEDSIDMYKNALAIDEDNLEALKGIAFCYQKSHLFESAIKYYTKIKHLTPFDKTVHYELGCLEYERENYCKAIKYFITAIKLSPEYYDAIYALGQAHEAIEEYEMAELIYLKILENRPSYLMAYNRLANLYIKQAEYQKGIKYFLEIININPEFHKAYLGIAVAYDNCGRYREAQRYYKKYLMKKPFSAKREYIINRLKTISPKRNLKSENKNLYLVK